MALGRQAIKRELAGTRDPYSRRPWLGAALVQAFPLSQDGPSCPSWSVSRRSFPDSGVAPTNRIPSSRDGGPPFAWICAIRIRTSTSREKLAQERVRADREIFLPPVQVRDDPHASPWYGAFPVTGRPRAYPTFCPNLNLQCRHYQRSSYPRGQQRGPALSRFIEYSV